MRKNSYITGLADENTQSILCRGSLSAKSNARSLYKPLFEQDRLPVTVRFTLVVDGHLEMLLKAVSFENKEIGLHMQSQNEFPAVSFGTESYYWKGNIGFEENRSMNPWESLCFYPVAGEQHLDPEKALACPPGFHFAELRARFARGPIDFRVEIDRLQKENLDTQLGVLSIHGTDSDSK